VKTIALILFVFLLVGCVEPDPMRSAAAQERTIQASNSQAAQNAQIERAQQSDADARNAQALLQALQAQQAIVAAQAAQAQAASQTAIVQSNNEALVLVADRFVEATRPDYTPLYVGMFGLVVIVIVWLIVRGRKPVAASPRLLFHSGHAEAWLLADGTIHLRRLSDGQARIYLPSDQMYNKLLTGGKG
jgi:multidrug efflux pump subunit AcrA (membrane-fusion protein)